MPDPTTTPGQVNYEAYVAALQIRQPLAWRHLPPGVQTAMEAAAQAVLAMKEETP